MNRLSPLHSLAPNTFNAVDPSNPVASGPDRAAFKPAPLQPLQNFVAGAYRAVSHAGQALAVDVYGTVNHVTGGLPDAMAQRSSPLSTLVQLCADNARAQQALQHSARSFGDALLDPNALTRNMGPLSAHPALLPVRLAGQQMQDTFANFKAALPENPSAYDWGYGITATGLALFGPTRRVNPLTPKTPHQMAPVKPEFIRKISRQFEKTAEGGITTLARGKQKVQVNQGVLTFDETTLSRDTVDQANFFSAVSQRLRKENIGVSTIQTTLNPFDPKGWAGGLPKAFSGYASFALKGQPPEMQRLLMLQIIEQTADASPPLHALDRRKPTRLTLLKDTEGGPVFSAHFEPGSTLSLTAKDAAALSQQLTPETATALDRLIEIALKAQ